MEAPGTLNGLRTSGRLLCRHSLYFGERELEHFLRMVLRRASAGSFKVSLRQTRMHSKGPLRLKRLNKKRRVRVFRPVTYIRLVPIFRAHQLYPVTPDIY